MKEKTIESTVLNVTHYFEEIENWATKIVLLQKGSLLYFGEVSDFFCMYPHYSVLKVDYRELEKMSEFDLTSYISIDTGDGQIVVCVDYKKQEILVNAFSELNVTFSIIKQNIYTTYLVACLQGGSGKKSSKEGSEYE